MAAKQNPIIVPFHATQRVIAAVAMAKEAFDKWGRDYERLHLGLDVRESYVAEARCTYYFSRFQASYSAWLRKARWATEDRLEADAKMFADYVARECRPIADVIALSDRRATP